MSTKKHEIGWDQCQEAIGVAYNEANKPIAVQCTLKRRHSDMHNGPFTIHNRNGTIYWETASSD